MNERLVAVVGYDDAMLLDIACVTSTLAAANRAGADPPYRTVLAAPGGNPVRCDSGQTLHAQASLEKLTGPFDTLVVSGGWGHDSAAADRRIVAHVRRLARESRRVASVCTGADILAAAGLLDGKRATTHWYFADRLAAAHPTVTIDPAPIFVRDGSVFTAAGVTSALDLTLALVEDDNGPDLARFTSRVLVTYLQRPADQAQMSVYVAAPATTHPLLRKVCEHITSHPDADLSTTELARRARVSQRQLTRLFTEHTGQTPGRYVREARLAAAARLLDTSGLSVTAVATRSGFSSAEALRQPFTRRYGLSPTAFRAAHTRRPNRTA
ncbi:GlxA family transcriptional regulator [Stackebrandtia nassauensis]|uniref:Transcriptional regulator, AraC family n=1 Tax=Stackebrandtia nassauensis (strain DSM 44728 / CIP 108903 / NRRL B-16338 / NBRC 102104 / LLR-40K-21) TaxID=446470 RepID=D3Q8L2_STANL|nr:DJ-1/PfpI family protein [Stackebrandtia nassauensis]ADD44454.1 transcriptional regulator, AraC family [Stackebrandtia nassauensis DSM 44728]